MRRHHHSEQLPGAQQMVLADDLIEARGTHPVGQRLARQRPRDRWEKTVLCGFTLCHWKVDGWRQDES